MQNVRTLFSYLKDFKIFHDLIILQQLKKWIHKCAIFEMMVEHGKCMIDMVIRQLFQTVQSVDKLLGLGDLRCGI